MISQNTNSTNIITNTASSIHSSSQIEFASSNLKKYWCHMCRREFQKIYIENTEIHCPYCDLTFCEEINQPQSQSSQETDQNPSIDNNPKNFRPYDSSVIRVNQQSNNLSPITTLFFSRGIRPRSTSNLLDLIIEYLAAFNYEDDIEGIINQIMMNDPNKYGNPPASKESVEKLEKVKIDQQKLESFGVENTCAVCKDEFSIGDSCMLMPCKHHFHNDCLIPWLKERNSCPVCRFELPTDDEDFEKRKLNSNNNHSNSNNRNNSNDRGDSNNANAS